MGKSAAHQAQQLQGEAASRYSNAASSLMGEAAPLRNQVSTYYSNIVKGGPAAYASVAPQVDFAKQQFNNAQKSLSETAPPGGAYMAGSRQLAETKAQSISNIYQSQIQNALQQLTGISQGETNAGLTATGGVSQAGNSLANLAAQQAQAWSSGVGGIAGALGGFFGLRGGAGGGGGGGGGGTMAFGPGY